MLSWGDPGDDPNCSDALLSVEQLSFEDSRASPLGPSHLVHEVDRAG